MSSCSTICCAGWANRTVVSQRRRPPLLSRAANLTRISVRFSNTPIWRTAPPRPLSATATQTVAPRFREGRLVHIQPDIGDIIHQARLPCIRLCAAHPAQPSTFCRARDGPPIAQRTSGLDDWYCRRRIAIVDRLKDRDAREKLQARGYRRAYQNSDYDVLLRSVPPAVAK